MDVDRDWRFAWIGFDGQPAVVAGVNLWEVEWAATGSRITVAHPQYPQQRHVMAVYEVKGSAPAVRFAAGEFSNGVGGFFVPGQGDDADATAYTQRNTVERAFGKLRQHRAVVTRFDKRDFVWCGTVDVASITIWLRDPIQ